MDRRLHERTAEEIRALLARRRMSAAELARITGIKQSTMARRMTGETALDLDDLERIAQALDVSVVDLLPREIRSQTTVPNVGVTDRPRDNRPNGRPGRGGVTPTSRRPVAYESSARLLPVN